MGNVALCESQSYNGCNSNQSSKNKKAIQQQFGVKVRTQSFQASQLPPSEEFSQQVTHGKQKCSILNLQIHFLRLKKYSENSPGWGGADHKTSPLHTPKITTRNVKSKKKKAYNQQFDEKL